MMIDRERQVKGGWRHLTSLTWTWMRGYSENKKSMLLLSKPLWHFHLSTFNQAEAVDIRLLSRNGHSFAVSFSC